MTLSLIRFLPFLATDRHKARRFPSHETRPLTRTRGAHTCVLFRTVPANGIWKENFAKDTRKRKNRIFLDFHKKSYVLEEKKSYRMVKDLS